MLHHYYLHICDVGYPGICDVGYPGFCDVGYPGICDVGYDVGYPGILTMLDIGRHRSTGCLVISDTLLKTG